MPVGPSVCSGAAIVVSLRVATLRRLPSMRQIRPSSEGRATEKSSFPQPTPRGEDLSLGRPDVPLHNEEVSLLGRSSAGGIRHAVHAAAVYSPELFRQKHRTCAGRGSAGGESAGGDQERHGLLAWPTTQEWRLGTQRSWRAASRRRDQSGA